MPGNMALEHGYNGHSANGDPYVSAVDIVYKKIRGLILKGELSPGQKLSEIGLSDQLSVSRTPVREALRRLSNDGFVLLVPKSGAWIASPTRMEVESAYAVRAHLETWAASMAAQNATPLFLARLDEQIQLEDRIFQEKDIEKYLDVNTAFHMIVAEASGNNVLAGYVADILAKTFIYMVFLESYFDFDNNPSLDEHRELLDAFTAKDGPLCVYLMDRHVKSGLANMRFK